MAYSEQRRGWRQHFGWLAGELLVVFVGVSAAFVVENYRDNRHQAQEFRQAAAGVIAELTRTETRGREFADAISAKITEWETADRNGQRAIPGYFRIPGSTHPPFTAWNTMVSSGLVRLIEPKLRTELGLWYSEFVGIHDNYDRHNQFTERPRTRRTPAGRRCHCTRFLRLVALRQWRWKPGKWKEIDMPITFRMSEGPPRLPPGAVPLPHPR